MVTSVGSGIPVHGNPATAESEKNSVKKNNGHRSFDTTARPGRGLDELSSGIKIGRRDASGGVVKIKHARLAASSQAARREHETASARTLVDIVGYGVELQESLLGGDTETNPESRGAVSELSRLTEVIRILSDSVRGSGEPDPAGAHARLLDTIDAEFVTPFFQLAERSTEVLARLGSDTTVGLTQASDPRPGLLADLSEFKAGLRGLSEELARESPALGGAAAGHIFSDDSAAVANAHATRESIVGQAEIAAVAHDPIPPEEAFVLLQD